MSESARFLELCAYELVRHEGVRVVKTPPEAHDGLEWTPGWDDWEEVLAADGPGVQPALYVLRNGSGLMPSDVQGMLTTVAMRVLSGLQNAPSGLHMKVVAILYFESVDASQAKALSRVVPDRYLRGVSPQVWVADLSTGKLWAPKALGVVSSRGESAVERALAGAREGRTVGGFEIAKAETAARGQRMEFVTAMRGNIPYITYGLLLAIGIIFALEFQFSHGLRDSEMTRALIQFGAMTPWRVEHGQYWRLFTLMFVHVSLAHILFNGIALYSVGGLVERIYGHLRFATTYFFSGIFASVVSFLSMVYKGENVPAAGASGAIFGIAGVVIVLGVLKTSIVPRAVARQLSTYMAAIIGVNLVFDLFTPEIDIAAHIGGLVAGLVLGYFLAPKTSVVHGPLTAADAQA